MTPLAAMITGAGAALVTAAALAVSTAFRRARRTLADTRRTYGAAPAVTPRWPEPILPRTSPEQDTP